MTLEQIFEDKTIKAKAKVATIGEWLMNSELSMEELMVFAEKQKSAQKAICIESIEYATKKTTQLATEECLDYVTNALKDEEAKIKWESARVIGNIASLFPKQLDKSIPFLLKNAQHEGTVVRWASAFALAEILKLKTSLNLDLLPKIERLSEKEEDNGVKKKYLDALKKVKK